ncbi:MAG: triose-phosphate isomerase [Candidatus Harrisonbacteria bacterium CG10_big_fil_rev_8_21_14_0_10_40_38]|uniref:Triosephosphate isomerase n=1 Tax=Candidatus Harrisonbacteria bacterium CG10_big_fil_rev_8_21_14_0_10_40_38 TaxID=1974583 RepID=A0A2H0UR55_9BACT|nr:MAG: triose-phosphate isomerase [Candidatus Harrisonbacteria bacterium CG10_big_fil_rev_8_21_14_0_10_40_38]
MNKLVIANWKMNPKTVFEATQLAQAIDGDGLIIAPPYPFISAIRSTVVRSRLAVQDIFFEDTGPFTGLVSGSQVSSLGVIYAVVGHSERRRMGDTDEVISKKIIAALRNELVPVVCIGENAQEKKDNQTAAVLQRQMNSVLAALTGQKYKLNEIVIAYEPVWAISTEPGSEPDNPENAVAVVKTLKTQFEAAKLPFTAKFIYGGSVSEANADGFLKSPDIEGALVGGASLKPNEIKRILELAHFYAKQ